MVSWYIGTSVTLLSPDVTFSPVHMHLGSEASGIAIPSFYSCSLIELCINSLLANYCMSSIWVSFCPSLSVFMSVYRRLSVRLFLSDRLCFSVRLCLFVFVCICLFMRLCLGLSVFLSVSIFLSFSVYLSFSLPLSVLPSVRLRRFV